MNMNQNNIGENAGIVWRALHNNRSSWEELVKTTELHPLELANASGWLARSSYSSESQTYTLIPTKYLLTQKRVKPKHVIIHSPFALTYGFIWEQAAEHGDTPIHIRTHRQ